jgi:CubicO group peptidase (beta-lactamase class C family)
VYAAVMILRPQIVAQHDHPALSLDGFQQAFEDEAKKGYGPVLIAATGSSGNPLFAAVFQPQSPIPLTRHRLTTGEDTDLNTIQGMNKLAKSEGLILRSLASYGDSGDPRFAAVWMPNPDRTLWNNDSLLDTMADYQARFNAQATSWCRPAYLTLNKDNRYASVFVNNEAGGWVARNNLSPDDYQNEYVTWTKKGLLPICVQAAGTNKNSARFAALFVEKEDIVPVQFHATGPVANAAIDAVIQDAMVKSPVRHAGLAIVHGTKLVYARGYTLAEPDWPLAQPTTTFRMASDSKIVTALAAYQLIASKDLHLSDKVQDILQLKTPSGGSPTDPNFKDITIQQLMEHTSGIDGDAFRSGPDVKKAWDAAGHPANLPVTEAMTDSYIASLNLKAKPGEAFYYNNCGYYLLGRVVAKKRNKSMIAACQQSLLDPLSIHRILLDKSLITAQPAGEARYQGPDLLLTQSSMSPDRPLVPVAYGGEQLEMLAGAGGLTGAPTDIARLVAMLIDPKDNPAFKRATITEMLSKAAAFVKYLVNDPKGMAMVAKGQAIVAGTKARAGYGWDGVVDIGGGSYYAQKGGNLPEICNSVVQFNGQWGFVMLWASPPNGAGSWYADYPAVMDIAKSTAWGAADLFPQYGMPSL